MNQTRIRTEMLRLCVVVALTVLASSLTAATLTEQISALEDPNHFAAVVKSGDAAIDGLVAALKGPRADLAAHAIGKIKSARAVPGLLAVIDSKDGELRAMAAWAIGECTGSAAPSN